MLLDHKEDIWLCVDSIVIPQQYIKILAVIVVRFKIGIADSNDLFYMFFRPMNNLLQFVPVNGYCYLLLCSSSFRLFCKEHLCCTT